MVHSEVESMRVPFPGVLMTVLGLSIAGTALAAGLPDEDQAAIRAAVEAFAKAASVNDTTALAALYTDDAILLPPNAPKVEGRDAIRSFFAVFPQMESFKLSVEGVDGSGDLAYTWGTYYMSFLGDDGGLVSDIGKFLDVKKKQADGSWLLYRDMYNSDLGVGME